MVVIAYGVCSEGMGHATRSKEVISALLSKGHTVHIFTSDSAYTYLSSFFDNVHEIKGFHLVYKDNKLLRFVSTIKILGQIPLKTFPTVKIMARKFSEIKPEVIISDHEVFSSLLGDYIGIPVISTSNISIVDKTKTELRAYPLSKFLTRAVDKLSNFRAKYFIIPTFFYPSVKRNNVILTSPVVRDEVRRLTPSVGNHILVYHTSKDCLSLLKELKGLKEECRIYGFGKQPSTKYMKYFAFSKSQFLEDLASAKAVITGGGFSLISESLYLKKPLLSLPLQGHYEQLTNAFYIQKSKFGEWMHVASKEVVVDFLLKRPFYEHYLQKYEFDSEEYTKTITSLVSRISKPYKSTIRVKLLSIISGGYFEK